ncbi:MFS transporter [Pigmentiphaga litoralis]|uniref:MFS transporter n=1 Tax=Pigmentiphaga litoralis TaxID=516702 RepID=UPI0019CD96B6|nr:MFS transporter [Pigmentiphaga litoralis]GGX03585.1 MFS transporter [Pigmentiphaga litoralis]
MTSAPPTESHHAAAPPDSRTLATRREWIGLAVIALPCLVYAMDLTVLNLALPAISEHLHPSSSQLLWIIDVYGFLVAGFLITMGTLGDRIGRRKLLLIGAAFFAVASTLAAFADSAGMLIAMRALLGIAGATLAPSTLSLIRNMFHDERQRQFAIGVWIASFSVGSAIGPLVGGVLLEFFWWGSVFLLALPVMALLLIVGPSLLPEYKDPNAGRIDLVSVALSLFAVLSIIYALKQLAEHGLHTLPLALLAAGVAVGTAFIRRQKTLAYPLLDLALFQSRPFSAAITAYALSCLAMFGVYIYISQYLQLVLGLSPLMAGVALLPWALGFVFGSLLSPRLSRHVAPQTIMIWGLLSSSVGFALVWMAGTSWGLPALIAGTIVMSLGMAPVFTVGNEIIVTAAPPERAGSASAISETSAEFSGALGIAIFGSLGTLIYRMAVSDGLPASLSAEQRATSLATLGGAVATAQAAPGPVADALLFVARDAFVSALQFTALVGGVLVLLAGVLTARILRDMPPKA